MNCLQLDIARQKENLSFIKDYFSKAKKWGYDTVILYIENAVRTSVTSGFSEKETYSKEEIREIVSIAEELGLEIIPALENLGHQEKFFAYPEWRKFAECENEQRDGRGFDPEPYGSCACPSAEEFLKISDEYIKEVVALFPSKFVHAGLDEVFDMGVCPECRARIESGESKTEIFRKHVLHTYDLLKSLGKTMMMWDDFFEYADIVRELPRDIILCSWNYGYIDHEPRGHWVNRIKRDLFRLYDELGFKYMYCVYAHRASSLYNIESFARYAEKYSPVGFICTAWCRQDSFYQGAYPFMAYCGALSSGKRRTASEIFAEVLGDNALAEAVLSVNAVDTGRNERVSSVAECRYLALDSYKKQLSSALERIKNNLPDGGEARDIAIDIYGYMLEICSGLTLSELANDVFDGYEQWKTAEGLACRLDEIINNYRTVYENGKTLWKKYREGVESEGNAFDKKYTGIIERLSAEKERLEKVGKRGVLVLEQMQFDAFGTPKCGIIVRYRSGKEEKIYEGALKPSTVAFEQSGCYYHRFATENEAIDYAEISFYGESASYPQYLTFTANGKKYVPESVSVTEGRVSEEYKLLENDTRFATFGYDDGKAHFNDIELSKKKNTVKIRFKEL